MMYSKNDDIFQCLFLLGHHHLDEFFVVNLTISVDIGFADHLVYFFVGKLLAQIGHNVTKFGGRDKAVAVLVEDLEGFQDFFFRVGILHLASHHCQELGEIDGSTAIGVNL